MKFNYVGIVSNVRKLSATWLHVTSWCVHNATLTVWVTDLRICSELSQWQRPSGRL